MKTQPIDTKTSAAEPQTITTTDADWTVQDVPLQEGRTIVITGTGGIGFENALELARAGGDVIIAGRNSKKGAEAVARILSETSLASVRFEQLDLASLKSIKAFAERLKQSRDSIDVLINNAGVMTPPDRRQTADGFELQFGTNYLGHFALTMELLPLLHSGKNPRVVTLSSIAARDGTMDFDDLQSEREHSYKPMKAYSQSKLACLMFALELQRRSDEANWDITSIGAHPGISRTDLLHNGPGRRSFAGIARSLLWFMFQPASQGALPSLFAATSPEAIGGGYYGPGKFLETRGAPTEAMIPKQALDQQAASRLWDVSCQLTGLSVPVVSKNPRNNLSR